MLNILSVLEGWKYVFPYFQENVPVGGKYQTLYKTPSTDNTGGILYAALVVSTPDFHLKISTGDTDLHEVDVKGLLYGQAPSGFNVPSGLTANVYIPIRETMDTYPIDIFDPSVNPISAVILEMSDLFPYKNGIELQVKADNPPQSVLAFSIGLVNIDDKEKYIKSLQKIYGGNNGNR